MGGKRAGVLLRVDSAFYFVPASIAVRIAPPPRVTAVPGAPKELLGVALQAGAVVPVISVGSLRGPMLVCQHAGELVGIIGAEIVRSGSFDVAPDRADIVEYAGERASVLDVAAIYTRVQAGRRSL